MDGRKIPMDYLDEIERQIEKDYLVKGFDTKDENLKREESFFRMVGK